MAVYKLEEGGTLVRVRGEPFMDRLTYTDEAGFLLFVGDDDAPV
jgi:hypothetical protein